MDVEVRHAGPDADDEDVVGAGDLAQRTCQARQSATDRSGLDVVEALVAGACRRETSMR